METLFTLTSNLMTVLRSFFRRDTNSEPLATKPFSLPRAKRLHFTALAAAVLASTTMVSEAIFDNGTISYRVVLCPINGVAYKVIVDPFNLDSFHVDFQYDASRLGFVGIEIPPPYTQDGDPDLSMISSGLVQDVAGISSILDPPQGSRDIFALLFTDLHPELGSFIAAFEIIADEDDFLKFNDPATHESVTFLGAKPPKLLRHFEVQLAPCPDSSNRVLERCLMGLLVGANIIQRKRIEFASLVQRMTRNTLDITS